MTGQVVGQAFPAPGEAVHDLGAPVEAVPQGPVQEHQGRRPARPMSHLQADAVTELEPLPLQRIGILQRIGRGHGPPIRWTVPETRIEPPDSGGISASSSDRQPMASPCTTVIAPPWGQPRVCR